MNASRQDQPASTPRVTVYYDGACPLCSREIGTYRRLRGSDQVCWVDVSGEAGPLGPGLTREAALARFHVRTDDGTLVSGGAAFVRLWGSLPALRWLAAIASRPPLSWALEPAYRLFLRLRPWLSRRPAGSPGV
jgi:predicted DCC family thiol-disulfide oxidoreductase YuxK